MCVTFSVSPVTGVAFRVHHNYCEQCPEEHCLKFNSMVLIQFLRSLVRIECGLKELNQGFQTVPRYVKRTQKATENEWFEHLNAVSWTKCSYDGLGVLGRLPVAAAQRTLWKLSENHLF